MKTIIIKSIVLYLLLTLILTGCSSNEPVSQMTSLHQEIEKQQSSQKDNASSVLLPVDNPKTILRLDGSNTIGAQLAPALVRRYLQSKGSSSIVMVEGELDNEVAFQAYLPEISNVVQIKINAHGSSTGFVGMEQQKTDIAMSSRPIKEAERLKLMHLHGDLNLGENVKVIGLDGLALITHPNNPLTQLSIEEIAKIFSGEINDWSELGWESETIQLLARDDNSGTFDSFNSMVLKPSGKKLKANVQRFESNKKLSDTVNKSKYSIGFVPLAHIENNRLIEVSYTTKSRAFYPNEFLINTEDYPLGRRLYLYKSGHNKNKFVDEFLSFAVSAEGQQIVENTNFVKKMIFTQSSEIVTDVPVKYQRLTFNHERLSLNFRLQKESSDLDPKAMEDLDRLAEYLKSGTFSSIVLVGFSDTHESESINIQRSDRRALMVSMGLRERGIKNVQKEGLGSSILLAPKGFDMSRPINDRIEVWVKRSAPQIAFY